MIPLKDSFSFPVENRLAKADEYRRVFERSNRIAARSLIALASDNQAGYPRLGLAISRKHVKTAVKRNFIKRKIREFFRLHQILLGSQDIIVLSSQQTTHARAKHIDEALLAIKKALIKV